MGDFLPVIMRGSVRAVWRRSFHRLKPASTGLDGDEVLEGSEGSETKGSEGIGSEGTPGCKRKGGAGGGSGTVV